MAIRRLLGLIMLLAGLAILVLSVVGAYYAGDAIGALAKGLSNSLTVGSQSLEAARATLDLARGTVNDVYGGLDTAVGATANAARTITDSQPLIDNIATVTTQEVPEAVEGIQAALPNMIEVASVIDRTLVTLSSVGIDRQIPLPFGGSIPLKFDLGIDYSPATSFDDSLRGFQVSLDGLPESLRGLEDDLQATNDNLASLATDLQSTSDNLTSINARVGEILPLLDQYSALVDQLSVTIAQVESDFGDRLNMIQIGVIALLIAVGLSQLAPIYLGWELLTGRRDPHPFNPPAAIQNPPQPDPLASQSSADPSVTTELPAEVELYQTDSPGDEAHA